MAIKEPPVVAVGDKGLQAGALGLVGNIVIGLAAVAPAYSLAATLGYVVLAVQEKAPSMFVLAFIPLMLACFAFGTKRFFRGETLNAETEVKVPDLY